MGAVLPDAGVVDVEMHKLDVRLPVTSFTKTLLTMFALERSDFVMNSLDVHSEIRVHAKLLATLSTLKGLLLFMNNASSCETSLQTFSHTQDTRDRLPHVQPLYAGSS